MAAVLVEHSPVTLLSGETLEPARLVKLNGSSQVVYADAGDVPIGVNRYRTPEFTGQDTTNQPTEVYTINGGMVITVEAAGTISAGATFYSANDGKIASSGTQACGTTLEAATAAGQRIKVIFNPFITAGQAVRSDRVVLFDDFLSYTNAQLWTSQGTDTEVVAMTDANNGILSLKTDATTADNDDATIHSTNEVLKFTAGKRGFYKNRVTFAEANTDDCNFLCGLMDTLTTGGLQANGAGPLASYDGAVFYKVDGGSNLFFECSNAGDQSTSLDCGAFPAGTYDLEFNWTDDGTTITFTVLVNGTVIGTKSMLLAGLEEMHVIAGSIKAGDTNQETLLIDYVHVEQDR